MESAKPDKLYIQMLVGAINKSDTKAFDKLFNLLWKQYFVYAKAMVGNEDTAKDIVQSVWIDFWNRRETLKNDNIEGYLQIATRNKCYQYFRDSKLNTIQLECLATLPSSSETELDHDLGHLEMVVHDTLEILPERCSQVFKLSRYDEASNDEIATRLGISKRTVENHLSLAMRQLRKSLSHISSFLA